MSGMIAKCGYNRNTKRAIIYGPAHLGGANFRSLYSVQGVGQLLSFIKYWRSPCQAGKLLRIAVAWLQHTLGTSRSFLQDTSTRLPHMEAKWLKSLRDYLKHVKGNIEVDQKYIPPLERIHDCYIMDAIIDSHQFNNKEIQRLNYCRLYLQAVTLSDLAQASGTHLDMAMLRGCPDQCSSVSRWHHVTQGRPDDKQWQLWRRANRIWSEEDGALKQPLKRWIVPVQHQRRQWQAYGDMKGRIYVRYPQAAIPHTYTRYQAVPKKDAQQLTVPYAIPAEVPNGQQRQQPVSESEVRLPTQVTPIDVKIYSDEYDSNLRRGASTSPQSTRQQQFHQDHRKESRLHLLSRQQARPMGSRNITTHPDEI
jgi:hypothetical protein